VGANTHSRYARATLVPVLRLTGRHKLNEIQFGRSIGPLLTGKVNLFNRCGKDVITARHPLSITYLTEATRTSELMPQLVNVTR
jgi:hypothetical protein